MLPKIPFRVTKVPFPLALSLQRLNIGHFKFRILLSLWLLLKALYNANACPIANDPFNVHTMYQLHSFIFNFFYKIKTLCYITKVIYAVDGTFYNFLTAFWCGSTGDYFWPFTCHPHSPLPRFSFRQKNAVVTCTSSTCEDAKVACNKKQLLLSKRYCN